MKSVLLTVFAVLVLCTGWAEAAPATGTTEEEFKASVLLRDQDMVRVHLASQENAKVKISIYSSNRVLLYRETVRKGGEMIKRYDLSMLPEGVYTVEVRHGAEVVKSKVALIR